ncbi:MAG: hypothetical protein Q9227_008592 [Pyrenula ochraceoflavens]
MALATDGENLIAALTNVPHHFLQPTPALYEASLIPVKHLLDPLATEISQTQSQRRQETRKKRKRGEYEAGSEAPILQLRQVYTEGFGASQIWEQAKRILDATSEEIAHDITRLHDQKAGNSGVRKFEAESQINGKDEGADLEHSDDESESSQVEIEPSDSSLDYEVGDDVVGNGLNEEVDGGEEIYNENESGSSSEDAKQETYVPDRHGLNDGFFSIDDFNRQSQFLEQQDVLGEDDGAASDEEDVDWSVNPLADIPAPSSLSKRKAGQHPQDKDLDSESDVEDGPTFGNASLNAPSDEDEYDDEEEEEEEEEALDTEDAMPGLENTNEVYYTDFFEPPARKLSKSKKNKPLPKTQPPPARSTLEDIDEDMQRAAADVKRDLFDDEEEEDLDESASSAAEENIRSTNLSTHEKQRAKIAKEIQRLEAASIAKKDWTLSGEARAAERPMNSLIEEDLEFERAGKPVPVITNEVSEEIEDLIKRRIIAKDFDEVLRRRPDAVAAQNEIRRGRVEVNDDRPQQSLADIYEQEHLRNTDPNYQDSRSQKLKREHAEIDRLWKDVSAKLDTLCNLHFKPKVPEANVNIVTDKPTISMEDARPTVNGDVSEISRLAPQEVYAPGSQDREKHNGEIMRKGGGAVAKEEMTREDKLRRRRRDKERIKKRKVNMEARAREKGGKAKEKQDILTELRRGGVKVIGNKGEVRDVDGKKAKKAKIGYGASDGSMRSSILKL